MNKLLTIVIPTYNMEKYLSRCLSSLIVSPLMTDLEVLVINDGSKDHSLEIAREYEKKYPNIFRAIGKENGNYGSCINRGLELATGKYFKVLDADDSFDTANFKEYMEFIGGQDADLIMSAFEITDLLDAKIETITYSLPVGMVFDFDYFAKRNVPYMWMHGVTHKTEKMRRIGYQQQEGISYTDKEFVFYPMAVSQTVCYFPKSLYRYVIGRSGQTVDDAVWVKNYWMEMKAVMKLVDLYEAHAAEVSDAGRLFMRLQLKLYINSIYYAFLKKYRNKTDLHRLLEFDNLLKNKSEECYHLVDNMKEKPYFRYIGCWRKGQYTDIRRYLFARLLHRIHYYLFKKKKYRK